MKNLNDIIIERLHITKNSKLNTEFSSLMFEIDVSKWEWKKVSLRQYDENKNTVQEFAKQEFGNNNYMEEIFKQTYKYYLKATDLPEKEIEKTYNDAIIQLNKFGWQDFSWSLLEQGWWQFAYWCIGQIKEIRNNTKKNK